MNINTSMMQAAFDVLNALKQHPDTSTFYIEAYSNGREQGFNLWNGENNRRVSFSKYRNADELVVYAGMYSDFSMQGNVPNESAWQNQYAFDLRNSIDAARFIVGYLKGVK